MGKRTWCGRPLVHGDDPKSGGGRVRFGRERGGWGEIGSWGDEREVDAATMQLAGEEAARRSGSVPAVAARVGEIWGGERGRVAEVTREWG
jgi:hypothetical protein